MIKKILSFYVELLSDFLQSDFPQPEGVAELGYIGNHGGEKKNKLIISLLGIERETIGGITPVRKTKDGTSSQSTSPLFLNINIIFAAIYNENRYAESLSVISATLLFLQTQPSFKIDGIKYTIEIISTNTKELNDIWTNLGSQYYPSIFCKIRRLTIDSNEIQKTNSNVSDAKIII